MKLKVIEGCSVNGVDLYKEGDVMDVVDFNETQAVVLCGQDLHIGFDMEAEGEEFILVADCNEQQTEANACNFS